MTKDWADEIADQIANSTCYDFDDMKSIMAPIAAALRKAKADALNAALDECEAFSKLRDETIKAERGIDNETVDALIEQQRGAWFCSKRIRALKDKT